MDYNILTFETIEKILLNTVFVSIPEEIFLVLFSLILMGEFNYWLEDECKKLFNSWDYPRILIPAISAAFISNILRYGGVNSNIGTISTILIMYVFMIFTNDVLNDSNVGKWMIRGLVSLLISLLVVFITEILCLPVILSFLSMSIEEINNNVLLNFLISLPTRIIQLCIITCTILRKRTLLKETIIRYILKSKILILQTVVICLFNIGFIIFMTKLVVFENFLLNFRTPFKFAIVLGISIFPILTTFMSIISPYYIESKKILLQKETSQRLNEIEKEISSYKHNKTHEDINWMLNKLALDIKEIADKLYKENNNN